MTNDCIFMFFKWVDDKFKLHGWHLDDYTASLICNLGIIQQSFCVKLNSLIKTLDVSHVNYLSYLIYNKDTWTNKFLTKNLWWITKLLILWKKILLLQQCHEFVLQNRMWWLSCLDLKAFFTMSLVTTSLKKQSILITLIWTSHHNSSSDDIYMKIFFFHSFWTNNIYFH